jgi:uncharacterized phage protein gp47/JayE
VTTLAEFTPLRAESVDTIRARVDAGVNAGLDPVDPRWTDTTPGGFFWDHTQVLSLEAELLWDFASTELPASFFLPFSWGIYLDYWGELLGVGRKDEARAIGEVTFTNTTAVDVPVGTGAEVAATTADPDAEPLVFTTTGSAVAPALGEVSVAVQAEDPGSQYNVAPGAVSLILSTLEGLTVTNAAAMSSGADVEADEAYKARLLVEFSSARGGGTREDYIAGALARPGVGGVVVEPRWAGPGTVLAAGYTITAEAGKEDISAAISAAVWAFERALAAGDDVLLNRVREAALKVPGVYDVPQVHINAVLANYAVTALQIARPGTVTLTTDAP